MYKFLQDCIGVLQVTISLLYYICMFLVWKKEFTWITLCDSFFQTLQEVVDSLSPFHCCIMYVWYWRVIHVISFFQSLQEEVDSLSASLFGCHDSGMQAVQHCRRGALQRKVFNFQSMQWDLCIEDIRTQSIPTQYRRTYLCSYPTIPC